MKFHEFDFIPEVMDGLDAMGFDECTPVQEQTMPIIMEGKDLIGCAQTGTGKTAAYLLPVLNRISEERTHGVNTLIIAPTRELVMQIDQQIEGFSYFCPVSSIPVYGGGEGSAFDQQKTALQKGADFVVATPGRLLSHMNLKYADFSDVKHLILDEADRMLDMGFFDDIMKIVGELPKEHRQTLLFSATMPPKIRKLSKELLSNPEEVNIAISKPAENILQIAYMVYDGQKSGLIKDLLKDKSDFQSILIFTSRKANVNTIVRELKKLKLSADGISSDLEQKDREEVLRKFKNRKTQILVATDIISRGIDIDGIELVLNYDVPNDAPDYVHRIGRTARAQRSGIAITLITEKDQHDFKKIEDLIEREVMKVPLPPELGEGPEYKPLSFKGGRKPFRKGGKSFKKKGPKVGYKHKGRSGNNK
jgi:superfamily II DNA/RNA helicase